MDQIYINVEPRNALGKKNKALRRIGKIPVHLYGLKEEALSLQADGEAVRLALRQAGSTTPVTVKIDGAEETITMIREVSRHPVSGDLLHVDFMRVNTQQEIEALVPVALIKTEEAPGIRGGAGLVTQGIYDVNLTARPFDMPNTIEVDCSVLIDLTSVIVANDLNLPNGVLLAGDPNLRVAWIQPPRVIEEDLVDEVQETDEEGLDEGTEERDAADDGEESPSQG